MDRSYELPVELAELKLKGGSLRFGVTRVECLGEQAWSETHVTSSRNGAGQVGRVSSYNVRKGECWVRMPGGRELKIALPDNSDFGVRTGHELLMISSTCEVAAGRSPIVAIINCSTGRWVELEHSWPLRKLAGVGGFIFWTFTLVFLVLTRLIGLIPIILYVARRVRSCDARISHHTRDIARWCLRPLPAE
jgi:hypothetical protein